MRIAQQFNHDFDNGVFRLFDSNRNLIYYENSTGFWWKREFDSDGNEICYEDSNGPWYKYEYDLNGNEIYLESSSMGVVFDNRPTSPCNGKIVEIDGKKYQLKELNQ